MKGPFAKGTFAGKTGVTLRYGVLPVIMGSWHQVIKDFLDADDLLHVAGERWRLLLVLWNRNEEVIGLAVEDLGGAEWLIELAWTDEGQGTVLDHFAEYVRPEA